MLLPSPVARVVIPRFTVMVRVPPAAPSGTSSKMQPAKVRGNSKQTICLNQAVLISTNLHDQGFMSL